MEKTLEVPKIKKRLAEMRKYAQPLQKAIQEIEGHFDGAVQALEARQMQIEKEVARLEESFAGDVLAGKKLTYRHIEDLPSERESVERRLTYLKTQCKGSLDKLKDYASIFGQDRWGRADVI